MTNVIGILGYRIEKALLPEEFKDLIVPNFLMVLETPPHLEHLPIYFIEYKETLLQIYCSNKYMYIVDEAIESDQGLYFDNEIPLFEIKEMLSTNEENVDNFCKIFNLHPDKVDSGFYVVEFNRTKRFY
jgi:hypothetical protein